MRMGLRLGRYAYRHGRLAISDGVLPRAHTPLEKIDQPREQCGAPGCASPFGCLSMDERDKVVRSVVGISLRVEHLDKVGSRGGG